MKQDRWSSLKRSIRFSLYGSVGGFGGFLLAQLARQVSWGVLVSKVVGVFALLFLVVQWVVRYRHVLRTADLFSQMVSGGGEYPRLPFPDLREYTHVQDEQFLEQLLTKKPSVCFIQETGRGAFRFVFLNTSNRTSGWLFQRMRWHPALRAWFYYYLEWIARHGSHRPRGWYTDVRLPEDRLAQDAPDVEMPVSTEDAFLKLTQWGRWSFGKKALVFNPVKPLTTNRQSLFLGRYTLNFF